MTTLPTIILEQKLHRQQAQLLIRFTYNKYLLSVLRSLQNVYWSSSLKTWYTKDTEENLALIFTAFKNKAHINSDRLYGKHTYERNLKKGKKNY
ncbi:hypothetical protein [Polaribacter tangerinus]|uniref:hypothetical protein n=1 Tax=Polaribacter tangerinus TaxID=1920034 RepID=UPI000B4BE26B|nr:hypothetical protein [Polaribacter tangerinus]